MAEAPLPDDASTVVPVSYKVSHELREDEIDPKLVDLVERLRGRRRIRRTARSSTTGSARRGMDWRGQGHFRALTEEQEVWAVAQGYDEVVVKTKNRYYDMRGTLDSLQFNVDQARAVGRSARVEGLPQQATRSVRARRASQPAAGDAGRRQESDVSRGPSLQSAAVSAAVQTPVIPDRRAGGSRKRPARSRSGRASCRTVRRPKRSRRRAQFGGSLDDHRYGPVEGLPALVAALEAKLARENGIRVRPASRVVVTAGGNLAFMNAMLAITDPGDEVIFPVPYYFNHEMAVVMAGARVVPVPTTARLSARSWTRSPRAITPRTRAVVTVSPNNPTGAVYPEAALRAVNALCRDARHLSRSRRGVRVLHVRRHARTSRPDRSTAPRAHTISLYSLSKAYGMASWRVGYMVIPEALWDAINKIQDTLLICAPAISQQAALAALARRSRATRARI